MRSLMSSMQSCCIHTFSPISSSKANSFCSSLLGIFQVYQRFSFRFSCTFLSPRQYVFISVLTLMTNLGSSSLSDMSWKCLTMLWCGWLSRSFLSFQNSCLRQRVQVSSRIGKVQDDSGTLSTKKPSPSKQAVRTTSGREGWSRPLFILLRILYASNRRQKVIAMGTSGQPAVGNMFWDIPEGCCYCQSSWVSWSVFGFAGVWGCAQGWVIGIITPKLPQQISRFSEWIDIIKSQLITQMDENEALVHGEAVVAWTPSSATDTVKEQRSCSQFQKNYPKNIFIPMIEYLSGLGFRAEYEQSVGTRQEFEGKNVVSLNLIHQLLSEEWFQRNVNKTFLEANISNKILMNSKIKKKLFHLRVTKILLTADAADAKLYKKCVSKGANRIARVIEEDDELFEHPSSVIYLLHLFSNSLKILLRQSPGQFPEAEDSDRSSSWSRQGSSKEELKCLTKSIIQLFNRSKCTRESLESTEDKIRQLIDLRAHEVNEKYQLNENVPFWNDFYSAVASKCFRSKMEGHKITNTLFNQWISEFKLKSNHIGLPGGRVGESQPHPRLFTPTILIHPPQE